MGAAANITNVPEILKYIWDDEVHDYQYEEAPFYGMVDKDSSWEGLYQIITVKYGGFGGRSGDFGAAKRNKSPAKHKKMQVETRDNFALWSVDNKLITLTRSNRGSLVRALEEATTAAQNKFKRSTSFFLWSNGGGAAAQIATAGISGAIATLQNPDDVRNYDIDDVCEFAADDGYTASAGVFTGTLTVIAIDEDNGKLTFDQNLSTILGLAAGHFIFHEGDYQNVIYGVPAYVTVNTPGVGGVPASIWGMDRTNFGTRLSGHRFTGSQLLIQEELKNALTKAFRRNSHITHLFMAPEVFNDLEMSLEGARRYADEKIGRVGFTGIEFVSQSGRTVKCFADPDIRLSPNGNRVVFGLNMDTWKFHTAEEWPMWLTGDGEKKFMTEENANSREGRLGGYGMLYTRAAGENFYLELS